MKTLGIYIFGFFIAAGLFDIAKAIDRLASGQNIQIQSDLKLLEQQIKQLIELKVKK